MKSVMSSKILGMKASSYVRIQAGIDWFKMLQGVTRILLVDIGQILGRECWFLAMVSGSRVLEGRKV